MRRVLVVSPHFPPDTSAGTHRVRLLAPHLPAHGWEATVVTVDPRDLESRLDPGLLALVPERLRVVRSRALPAADRATHAPSLPAAYASTVALSLANPVTIVAFVGIFSALGIGATGPGRDWSAGLLVGGVFLAGQLGERVAAVADEGGRGGALDRNRGAGLGHHAQHDVVDRLGDLGGHHLFDLVGGAGGGGAHHWAPPKC